MSKKRRKNVTVLPAESAHANFAASRPRAGQILLVMAAIALVTGLVYWQCLQGPFLLDDEYKIVTNPDIRSLRDLPHTLIYPYDTTHWTFARNDPSRPLVYLTFALNYHVGKLDPIGYHLVNLLVHLLNALLVFLVLYVITGRLFQRWRLWAPGCGALLFALHPVNAGTVNYIFCRSDLLATCFILGALLLWLVRGRWAYFLSLLAFAMALLSKQSAVVLPALVLCLEYLLAGETLRREVLAQKWRHLGLWAMAIGYLLLRTLSLGGLGDMEAQATWGRSDYLLIQPYAALKYLQFLVAPVGLCIDHFLPFPRSFAEPRILLSLLMLIALTLGAYLLVRRQALWARVTIFTLLWMLVTLAPTSSFFPTTSALAENRLYLPSIAFALLATMGLRNVGTSSRGRGTLTMTLILLYIGGLGAFAAQRCYVYRTPLVLWQEAVHLYPNNARAHMQLGIVYGERQEYKNAQREFESALRLNPNYPEAHENYALLQMMLGRNNEAINSYEKVLALKGNDLESQTNLGVLYAESHRFADAERIFIESMERYPDSPDAYHNLAYLYMNEGRFTEAEDMLLAYLAKNAHDTNTYLILRELYAKMGKTAKLQRVEEQLETRQPSALAENEAVR